MVRPALVGILAWTSLALGACRRRPPPMDDGPSQVASTTGASVTVDPPKTTPKGEWTSYGSLKFTNYERGLISVMYKLDRAEVTFSGFPKGTKVMVGEKAATLEDFQHTVTVDIGAAYGDLDAKMAFEREIVVRPKQKLTITFSNGVTFEDSLPRVPQPDTNKVLAGATEHSVQLGDEGEKRGGLRSVAFLDTSRGEVVGPAKTLREVDWVAVRQNQAARPGKSCSYQRTDLQAVAYRLDMVDQTVTVHDRHTGQRVHQKTFKAREQCPTIAVGGHAESYPSYDEMKAWLRGVAAKKKS